MEEFLNPYIAGAPVTESSMFFGREDVFGWIERSLAGKFVDHILVIHGQRRVGKTSVLKQIPHFLGNQYLQIFFDLQGRVNTNLERFLWWMARETTRTLTREHGFSLPKPEEADFESNPDFIFTDFFPNLHSRLSGRTLLLTFDEFDILAQEDIQETLARPLITTLAHMMELEGLNFIFSIGSSGSKLENMQASYTNFFKSALYRKISFLDRDSCRELITRPVAGYINYQPKAVQRIYEFTAGHPYFTQLMCHELFSLCQKADQRSITPGDVESVVSDVIERGTVNLKFVWDEASNLEKWVLASLAHHEDGLSNEKLAYFLHLRGVNFLETDLNSAVIHLRDKDVITPENRFVIYLMRLWLRQNRPLDRVREELTEVNPIANRFIEIGNEYRARGDLQNALENYRQALAAAPDFFEAHFNIAETLLENKDFPGAAGAYQRALEIHPSDVGAQNGLCAAHVKMGDLALDNGQIDTALDHFQHVLTVSPSHSDARLRLAHIYHRQAETHLEQNNDDLALRAFQQALEYTPHDRALQQRYNDLREQKKNEVIRNRLARAEQALVEQRWDKALEMTEEALNLDPENSKLQQALQDTRREIKKQQLTLLEERFQNALSREDWKDALEAVDQAAVVAPHDPGWEKKQALVEETRHRVHVNGLWEQVQQARVREQWDQALDFLNELLIQEPDDRQALQEIAAVRRDQRESQLTQHRSKALAAESDEDWEQAVLSWDSYLSLEPDNREEARNALDAAREQEVLSRHYRDAREALHEKNYSRAISLLQDIISRDPTYKSSSRLLTEAVDARRKKSSFWKPRYLYPLISLIILAVIGFFVVPRVREAFPGLFSSIGSDAGDTESSQGVGEWDTDTPSPTGTPLPARAFAEPYLAFIADHEPGYFIATPPLDLHSVNLEGPEYNRVVEKQFFVLQFEIDPVDFTADQPLMISFSSSKYYGSVNLEFQQEGPWAFYYRFEEIRFDVESGAGATIDPTGNDLVQLIVSGQEMAVFINQEPLFYLEKIQMQGDLNWSVLNTISCQGGQISQIKIWDLSGIHSNQTGVEPAGEAAEIEELIYQIMVAEGGITSLAWAPSGDRFAAASKDAGGVRVVDFESGEITALWSDFFTDILAWSRGSYTGYSEDVLLWSPGGNAIAAGNEQGMVILFNPDSGEIMAELETGLEKITALEWSRDGDILAAGDDQGTIAIYDIARLKENPDPELIHITEEDYQYHEIKSLAISPTQDRILVTSYHRTDRTIQLILYSWDQNWSPELNEGFGIGVIPSNTAWSPDGSCYTNAARHFQINCKYGEGFLTNSLVDSIHAPRFLAWSPDGKTLAAASLNYREILLIPILEVTDGKVSIGEIRSINMNSLIETLAWSPESEFLLAGDGDGYVWVLGISN